MIKYDTVIFDMDGTLLDTLTDLTNTLNYALQKCDYPIHSKDAVRTIIGDGIRNLILRAMPKGEQNNYDKVYAAFVEYYVEHSADNTIAYEGINELLLQLKQRGIKRAIVSNKVDLAVKQLSDLFFGNLIDVAIGESETIRVKPNPDGINEAMRILNADIKTTVYVGDGEADIMTAKNAGVDCISVSYGFRTEHYLLSQGAERIARSVAQLSNMLLN